MINVALISLGCAKNLVDSELMLGVLKENDINIVIEPYLADVVVINTCGFLEQAKQEAIESILEIIELKKEGKIKGIIVAGCLSQRYKEEIEKEFPEVDGFLGTGSYNEVFNAVTKILKGNKFSSFNDREQHNIDGQRVISTPSYSAYIKISEGCDNLCSYCAIPLIRGAFRSRKIENIVNEAKLLAKKGVKEIILIAQDTTRYGLDLYNEYCLPKLLNELCKIEQLVWIRVLYFYPERITDELLDVMANEEKIVKYIEMPIQHSSEKILKAMNRKGNSQSLLELIKKIREKIPNVIIRTTVIVGFPNETKKDFLCLATFVKEAKFERLGVFTYSQEEGTKASLFKGQISQDEKLKRQEIISFEQNIISEQFCAKQIGKTFKVIVEGYDKYGECYFARSYMEAPEIDGKIFIKSQNPLKTGDFYDVIINETMEYDLIGILPIED